MVILGTIFILLAIHGTTQSFSLPKIVGFTKGQTSHLHLTAGNKIMFNKNITMVGAKFNSNNGDFICDVPGLYVFSIYSLTETNKHVWLELRKNGQLIVSLRAYMYGDFADASNTAVLSLKLGDRVFVKAHDHYDNSLFGLDDEIYTTFVGELIHPDYAGNTSTGAIGFTSALSSKRHFNSGDIVKYDHFVTNMSNQPGGYDVRSGKFTAPSGGVYVFYLHASSHSSKEFWLELFINNQYINSLYGQTRESVADAGNTAVLHLQRGDNVYVKSRQSFYLYGTPNELYTTFSGILLIPDLDASKLSTGPSYMIQDTAFSVGLTHDYDSANGHSTIIFNHVITNIGNAYDVRKGIFTAPAAGLYAFYFHVLAEEGQEVWAELRHNSKYIDSAYGDAHKMYGYGSNAAVLKLISGDKAYIEMRRRDHSVLYGRNGEVFSTFSGYHLAPIPDFHFDVVG